MTMIENSKTQVTLPSDQEILITPTFDAPRELVWQMWTTAEHLQHWWGPEGWALPVGHITLKFMDAGGKTTVINTVRYPTKLIVTK